MKVSIYYLNKELVLTNDKEYCKKCDKIITIHKQHSFSSIYNYFKEWMTAKDKVWCFYFENDFIFHSFLGIYLPHYFEILYAAGGVIFNPQKQAYLFIYKRGKWDLPKGKIDAAKQRGLFPIYLQDNLTEEKNNIDEQPEMTAIRECIEETGISNINIKENIGITYHLFEQKNQMILKITQWYLMETSYSDNLTPQVEEGIEKVEWLSKSDIKEKLIPQTYPSIVELLKRINIIK